MKINIPPKVLLLCSFGGMFFDAENDKGMLLFDYDDTCYNCFLPFCIVGYNVIYA